MDSEFLSSEEKFLLDEMKFVQKIMADAESSYGTWEGWYIASQGILLAALGTVIGKSNSHLFLILICIVGIILCLQFFLIQWGNYIYATSRKNRWRDIEDLISKELNIGDGKYYMQILNYQAKEKDNHKWYSKFTSTWTMRILIPSVFGLTWILILICSLTS